MSAMEAATMKAAAEITTAPAVMPTAEANTERRATHISRAIPAIVGIIVSGVRVADRAGGISKRRTDPDHNARRRRRGSDSGCTSQHQCTQSNFHKAFHDW